VTKLAPAATRAAERVLLPAPLWPEIRTQFLPAATGGGVQDTEPLPPVAGRFEQRREAPAAGARRAGRRGGDTGKGRVIGAHEEPAAVLDQIHARQRAAGIVHARERTGGLDQCAERGILAAHPHRAVADQIDGIQHGLRTRWPDRRDVRRREACVDGGRRVEETEPPPRSQGMHDPPPRVGLPGAAMPDVGGDQLLDVKPGVQRLPETPPGSVEGADGAIGRDGDEPILPRQRLHRTAQCHRGSARLRLAPSGRQVFSVVSSAATSTTKQPPQEARMRHTRLEEKHGGGRGGGVAPEGLQYFPARFVVRACQLLRWESIRIILHGTASIIYCVRITVTQI
jgi:hypothetical protein